MRTTVKYPSSAAFLTKPAEKQGGAVLTRHTDNLNVISTLFKAITAVLGPSQGTSALIHIPSGLELLAAATSTGLFPLGVPGVRRPLPFPPLVCVIAKIAGGCTCILCFCIAAQRASAARGCVHAWAGSILYTQAGRDSSVSNHLGSQTGTSTLLESKHRPGCSSPPLHCPSSSLSEIPWI